MICCYNFLQTRSNSADGVFREDYVTKFHYPVYTAILAAILTTISVLGDRYLGIRSSDTLITLAGFVFARALFVRQREYNYSYFLSRFGVALSITATAATLTPFLALPLIAIITYAASCSIGSEMHGMLKLLERPHAPRLVVWWTILGSGMFLMIPRALHEVSGAQLAVVLSSVATVMVVLAIFHTSEPRRQKLEGGSATKPVKARKR